MHYLGLLFRLLRKNLLDIFHLRNTPVLGKRMYTRFLSVRCHQTIVVVR